MAADHGSDFSCIDDLSPNLTTVSGRTCLAQALCRRLITPRGGLFYDEDYGTDVREFLNAPINTARIAQAIEAECLKDERVADVSATVTITGVGAEQTIEVVLSVTDDDGPFPFTLSIGNATAELFLEAA